MKRSGIDFETGIVDAQARQMVLGAIDGIGVDLFDIQVKTQLPMSTIHRVAEELFAAYEVTRAGGSVIAAYRRTGDMWEGG